MWNMFEPIHAVTYFAPEARSAYEQAGLRGFWRGYSRPGGAARRGERGGSHRLVLQLRACLRRSCHPRRVGADHARDRAADPAGGRDRSPADPVRRARTRRGRGRRPALAGDAGSFTFSGRVLAAANVALPVRQDGLARLWLAATVLRERRGDGHFAALAAADIDGCEAVALRCCLDLRREDLQPVRGWTDEAWDEALSRLAGRGWVGGDGELTSAGPAGARGGGERHRLGRGATVGPARPRRHGGNRERPDPA